FNPGDMLAYSNSGYALLGYIIEQISGQSYEQFLKTHIFKPLGMHHTCYDRPLKVIKGRVSGYNQFNTRIINAPYLSTTWPYAAGALASNVDDLHIWNQALSDNKLISAGTFAQAKSMYTLNNGEISNCGYGWLISRHAGLDIYEHAGGINGFLCHCLRAEQEGLVVTLLTNQGSPVEMPNDINFKILCAVLDKPYEKPEPINLPAATLAQYTGQYRMGMSMLNIDIEDGHLVLFGFLARPAKYYPISPNEFACIGNEFNLAEFKHTNGDIELIFRLRGMAGDVMKAKKVHEPS
ncbi:MAG: serine hydrolase domain-containing protein, partial [Pseudomonadota bacterium]